MSNMGRSYVEGTLENSWPPAPDHSKHDVETEDVKPFSHMDSINQKKKKKKDKEQINTCYEKPDSSESY